MKENSYVATEMGLQGIKYFSQPLRPPLNPYGLPRNLILASSLKSWTTDRLRYGTACVNYLHRAAFYLRATCPSSISTVPCLVWNPKFQNSIQLDTFLNHMSPLHILIAVRCVSFIIPAYYKRNRHFQCCIETKLLMI